MKRSALSCLLACSVALLGSGPRAAIADSMADARKRIMQNAMTKAVVEARKLPTITEKAFVDVWRPRFDELVSGVCKCDPVYGVDLDASGNPTRKANACVVEAFDEFTIDLAVPSLRLPGMLDALGSGKSDDEIGAIAKATTEKAINDVVPAKEALQRQQKLRHCMEAAGVL